MKTATEILRELGVSFRGNPKRSFKTTCPRCSHTRKHKDDPCLSVKIDGEGVVGNCHNCAWAFGRYFESSRSSTERFIAKVTTAKYDDMLKRARLNWR
jgi:twinkle protein